MICYELSVEKGYCYKCQIDYWFPNVALTGTLGIWVKESGPQYHLLIVNWNIPSNDTAIVAF